MCQWFGKKSTENVILCKFITSLVRIVYGYVDLFKSWAYHENGCRVDEVN